MDKQDLLNQIRQMSQAGQLSRAEVLAVMSQTDTIAVNQQDRQIIEQDHSKNSHLSEILYYIGGAIVFLGICVLFYQNWDVFDSTIQIAITFGSFLASFIVATVLHRYQNFKKIAHAFFLLAGLLAPLGISVLLKKTGVDISATSVEFGIYAVLTAVFLAAFWYFRQTVLLLFSILFVSALMLITEYWIIGPIGLTPGSARYYEYGFLAIVTAYMPLGYFLKDSSQAALTGMLYFFGSSGFLLMALVLGGYQPNQSAFWEIIYPLLAFGIIFLSVYVKSRSFLVFGGIFLIAYILKLTAEYFSHGLGWPLALVVAGLLIIVVGYYAIRVNKNLKTQL